MAEIIAFVAGCLFSLLLAGICLFVSYKVIDFKETTESRREERKKQIQRKKSPESSGGVIRPKTQEEIDRERNEEATAFADLLNQSQDTE